MAAAYPDMFAAASEFSGEPAGCFALPNSPPRSWNSQCAGGQINKSPAEWAQVVKKMYPSYTGQYPKMQIFHGDADTTLNIRSYNESIKEWSGVHGYSGNPTASYSNTPGARLTKYIYGDRLQGIWGSGIGHVVPTNETEALQWFGIIGGGSGTTPTQVGTSTRASVTASATAAPPTGNCAAKWGQCGGEGYTGPKCCQSGSTCTVSNQWYSQCL
jgi:acetylxylan esterase